MVRPPLLSLWFSLGLIGGLCGCANEELTRLRTEVSDLHSRLYQMQRSSERQTSTTTDSLQQVSQNISEGFDEIRFSQSGLEEKINQLSNRLLAAEQELEAVRTSLAQQQNRMEQGTRSLRQDIAKQEQDYQASFQKSTADVADLRQNLASLQERQQKDSAALNESIRTATDNLENRINSLDKEVQSVYRDILKELGAAPTPQPQGYSADVYTVAPGDTLTGIAQSLGISASALQELNGITDPNKVYVGQRLKVPK